MLALMPAHATRIPSGRVPFTRVALYLGHNRISLDAYDVVLALSLRPALTAQLVHARKSSSLAVLKCGRGSFTDLASGFNLNTCSATSFIAERSVLVNFANTFLCRSMRASSCASSSGWRAPRLIESVLRVSVWNSVVPFLSK